MRIQHTCTYSDKINTWIRSNLIDSSIPSLDLETPPPPEGHPNQGQSLNH